jgi:glycerate 2-kinase
MIGHPSKMRQDAEAIFRAGVEAVDPERAVRSALRRRDDSLLVGEHRVELPPGRIYVVGAGKAAGPMAAAVEEILGELLAAGVVVTKYGHGQPLRKVRLLEAGHPVPDENGLEAGREISALLEKTGEQDLVICLISGGGSALLPAPDEVSLSDKMDVTRRLLASGAEIAEVNAVRKHLSSLKGGGLARLAAPSRVVSLILSDVVGDPLDVIASGPTVPDPSTFADAREIIRRYGFEEKIPVSLQRRLERGLAGEAPETPKAGDPVFDRVINLLVGNNARAIEAAAEQAQRLGYRPLVLSTTITGETREVAGVHAAIAREAATSGRPAAAPLCLLSGGETTVTLRGEGKGGRNQEFALAAALQIGDLPGVMVLSAGTDGTDGPTDAAGAFADGTTLARARKAGLSPRRHLEDNDAYPFFAALGDLLITGPTRTNVMDLRVILVRQRRIPAVACLG